MKTFTTSIFVPGKKQEEMNKLEAYEMKTRINNKSIPVSNVYAGALDDVVDNEEFILIVNGPTYKHEILMRGNNDASGKTRFAFVNPELPEVYRFAQWRVNRINLISMRGGKELQLRGFTAIELRRIIRASKQNNDKSLVKYR